MAPRLREAASGRAVENGHERERRVDDCPADVAAVRLTRKYAEAIDGINLAGRGVGDRLPLREREARLLIAEGWAEPVPAVLGVFRGSKDIGTGGFSAVGETAEALVTETAAVGGSLGSVAKNAVEGAIQGAREVGLDVTDAASAAATGAVKAAGKISKAATEEVTSAVSGVVAGVKVIAKAPFKA